MPTKKEEVDVNNEQQLLEHISERAASFRIASVDAGDGLVCNVMTNDRWILILSVSQELEELELWSLKRQLWILH